MFNQFTFDRFKSSIKNFYQTLFISLSIHFRCLTDFNYYKISPRQQFIFQEIKLSEWLPGEPLARLPTFPPNKTSSWRPSVRSWCFRFRARTPSGCAPSPSPRAPWWRTKSDDRRRLSTPRNRKSEKQMMKLKKMTEHIALVPWFPTCFLLRLLFSIETKNSGVPAFAFWIKLNVIKLN